MISICSSWRCSFKGEGGCHYTSKDSELFINSWKWTSGKLYYPSFYLSFVFLSLSSSHFPAVLLHVLSCYVYYSIHDSVQLRLLKDSFSVSFLLLFFKKNMLKSLSCQVILSLTYLLEFSCIGFMHSKRMMMQLHFFISFPLFAVSPFLL